MLTLQVTHHLPKPSMYSGKLQCSGSFLFHSCCFVDTRSSRGSLIQGAVVAQLASAQLSEREVPGSIFSDFNVCFDFPLIRVAIALNTRKTEH